MTRNRAAEVSTRKQVICLPITYRGLDSSSCSQHTVLAMLSHPMEFKIERLLGHVAREKIGQEVANYLLRQSCEDIEWRDVEDLRPPVLGVSLVHKQSVVILTSSEE